MSLLNWTPDTLPPLISLIDMSDSESQDPEKPLRKTRKVITSAPSITEEKPKRVTRTRKIDAEETAPATMEEAPPKRVVKRKTTKAESAPAEETQATLSFAEVTEEKPKRVTRKKTVEAEESASAEIPALEKKRVTRKKARTDDPSDTPPPAQHKETAPESSESDDNSKKIRRTTIKRISIRPGNKQEGEEGSTQVIERVSSLTDSSPVEALPTQNSQLPENRQRRDRNDRHPGKNNRFQNGKNDRRNNNKNNRFNKSNNRQNNRREQYNEGSLVETGELFETEGMIEFAPKGYGFLRTQENDFDQTTGGVYVGPDIIRKYSLRHCQWIHGKAINTNRGVQLREIIAINELPPEEAKSFPHFEDLKAVNPNKRISLETTPERYTTRVIDMMAPIGRGQRGLIVAPPRTGKTVLLQHMAEAIVEKYSEEIHLMILLIDERPEEVTEFKRGIKGAEVFASSNDGRVREHCRLAELCIERAKRLVEAGKHVVILMDSITRLARAYNNASAGNGRTMSGGIDAKALEMPRRLFASARNTREAGSLTIIATALIETNSRMDDLIFQEFKGTGNMELVLNRRIAEQYIYPAVDILKSGTRREELILPELVLDKVNLIRRALAGHRPVEAMERLLFFLKKYPNNAQMLIDLKQRA